MEHKAFKDDYNVSTQYQFSFGKWINEEAYAYLIWSQYVTGGSWFNG